MSSEMREMIAKWRDLAQKSDSIDLQQKGQIFRWCANDLETLLARAEAGADRAVAYRVRRGNGSWGIPHEYLPGSPATIAALCDEGCEVQYLHPQDASGDAVTGRVNGYMFSARAIEIITDGEVPEWITKDPGLRVTITAMQAKEAK